MQVALKVAGYKLPRLKVASFLMLTKQPWPKGHGWAFNLGQKATHSRTTYQATNQPWPKGHGWAFNLQ
ncbi:MAG: hypothetical protein F6J98_08770 [Moorea sp. SIO4G2]|uniref:Uncharacterized protein n=1 Tax=Moorena bouillonii PNG TaxID=568701 RepID=A0A1U7N7X8_9CYAN|nr:MULTISPECIES: hypothetical protein [Moorena]NEO48116.1 hypothetical protein [Moorena sp. SIO4A3]NEO60517.1 hypothetical protein [Moorena sp. SIO4G2]NEO17265.1 hypothetical protein [Moorena sp. SIO3E8]NEQ03790.1 hypothetical protein [Moorena sp. SIO3F7]OLT62014.1 hypothetical protein BJP37_26285 [Moorena bouillonii PNG]